MKFWQKLPGYGEIPEMQKSSVFDQTYHQYLAKILTIDYLGRADMLGVERDDQALLIPLYDTKYLLSGKGISARDGIPVVGVAPQQL